MGIWYRCKCNRSVCPSMAYFKDTGQLNIDIVNIGHYRLTSHGGRRFDLYNRDADIVYSISQSHYETIKKSPLVATCEAIEFMVHS